MLGADALPEKWVGVLNDRLISAVWGYSECKISELAKRSYKIAKKVMATSRNRQSGPILGGRSIGSR